MTVTDHNLKLNNLNLLADQIVAATALLQCNHLEVAVVAQVQAAAVAAAADQQEVEEDNQHIHIL